MGLSSEYFVSTNGEKVSLHKELSAARMFVLPSAGAHEEGPVITKPAQQRPKGKKRLKVSFLNSWMHLRPDNPSF